MKKEIQDFLGQARWTRLEAQAIEQGRDLNAVCDHSAGMAQAAHPENPRAAAALAALRVLVACNSQPTLQDTHNYELAQKSDGQHPSDPQVNATRKIKTLPPKPPLS